MCTTVPSDLYLLLSDDVCVTSTCVVVFMVLADEWLMPLLL